MVIGSTSWAAHAYSQFGDVKYPLGFTHFEWIHSGGSQQPRSYHMRAHPSGLNHGIFRIDEPPVIDPNTGTRGFPGDLPNCRCTMRPVLKFEDEEK